MTIADVLDPKDILLDVDATELGAAVDEVIALLQHDERVQDWEAMRDALLAAVPCLDEPNADFAISLPHARTEAVTEMVMSVGRIPAGLECAGVARPVRYIVCVATPRAMAAEYLRMVGLLARVLRNPAAEEQLRNAETTDDFLAALERLEAKL
jgi:mannitol/fructose-specific phosphotransferase system IIA component (Ntr-type)